MRFSCSSSQKLRLVTCEFKLDSYYIASSSSFDSSSPKSIERIISHFLTFDSLFLQRLCSGNDNLVDIFTKDDLKPNNLVSDVVIVVKFKYLKSNHIAIKLLRRLIRDGIRWNDSTYDYFAWKESHDKAYFIQRSNKLSANILRRSLFGFDKLSSIYQIGARSGLFLSDTCSGIVSDSIIIHFIDDLVAVKDDGSESLLTDGSGYISYDLAIKLPRSVFQGQITNRKSQILPAVFQVRVLSIAHGIFKGTLLVRRDLENTIILRKSMRKVPAGNASTLSNKCFLDIVNTSRLNDSFHGSLNRHLILTLHALGVPAWVFTNMVRQEICSISTMMSSAEAAMNRCRQESSTSDLAICLSMLEAGIEVDEPFIQAVLWQTYRRDVDHILDLRLPCAPAAYLIGIPDPYNILAADEVYIYSSSTSHAHPFNPFGSTEADVLVTRFPLLRSSSIAIFHSVRNPVYQKLFTGLSGDVIVFSSKPCAGINGGGGSAVDCMGGDYDGDLYFVCGDYNLIAPILDSRRTRKCTSFRIQSTSAAASSSQPQLDESIVIAPIAVYHPRPFNFDSLSELDDEEEEDSPIIVPTLVKPIVFNFDHLCISPSSSHDKDLRRPSTTLEIEDVKINLNSTEVSLKIEQEDLDHRIRELLRSSPSQLSDDDLHEAINWEYFLTSFSYDSHRNPIAEYAVDWLIEADLHGPDSHAARLIAEKHDQAMDARKLGRICEDILSSSDHLSSGICTGKRAIGSGMPSKPHHLQHRQASSSSSTYYHSSSILGVLYDQISSMIDEVDSSIIQRRYEQIVADGVKLDLKMHRYGAENYLLMMNCLQKHIIDDLYQLHAHKDHNLHTDLKDMIGTCEQREDIFDSYQSIVQQSIEVLVGDTHHARSTIELDIASALYQVSYLAAKNAVISSATGNSGSSQRLANIDTATKKILTHSRCVWKIFGDLLIEQQCITNISSSRIQGMAKESVSFDLKESTIDISLSLSELIAAQLNQSASQVAVSKN
jgi:hypothetical protein